MSLFSMLGSAANTMSVFENAMAVTQNNVANASTPGYAKQIATFDALPFDQGTGNLGGVVSGPEEDTRSQYAEDSVRTATTQLGTYEQQVNSLTPLQSQFDITGTSGIPAALSSLYSAFSTWATNPNNASAQQNVITQAQDVASAFNTTASSVAQTTSNTDNDLSSLVDKVNTLVGQLGSYNAQIEAGDKADPGLQASVNSTIESLSKVADITTSTQPDGAVNVMLGSQTMLLSGTNQNKLSVTYAVPSSPTPSNPLGPPDAKLVDSYKRDVTSSATGGQLGGILTVRNQVLPAIQGDGSQDGSLNQLAKGFADQVNTVIGFPLFTYDTTDATNTAASLSVSSTTTLSSLPTAEVTALTGTAVSSPITITTGTNDQLSLQVDGKPEPPITIGSQNTTMASVASSLNTQFTSLGIGATATVSANGALVLSTTNTSSTGSIAILNGSANSTLGLSSATPTYSNGANSIALNLANLANASSIDGQSFVSYFGGIASGVGTSLANAQAGQTAQQSVVTQAQTMRQQISGVDLNTEAATLLQYQNSYEAASKMVTVINSLTTTVLNMIGNAVS